MSPATFLSVADLRFFRGGVIPVDRSEGTLCESFMEVQSSTERSCVTLGHVQIESAPGRPFAVIGTLTANE